MNLQKIDKLGKTYPKGSSSCCCRAGVEYWIQPKHIQCNISDKEHFT
jgi:hypothetical protein